MHKETILMVISDDLLDFPGANFMPESDKTHIIRRMMKVGRDAGINVEWMAESNCTVSYATFDYCIRMSEKEMRIRELKAERAKIDEELTELLEATT